MFLKIFSRRKRRAVSVICPAARVGPLLAHNTVPTQWKNPPKNWQKLQKLQLPLIKHIPQPHSADRQMKETSGSQVKNADPLLPHPSINPSRTREGRRVNCAEWGWVWCDAGKDLQGSEIRLGKFTAGSNEEPTHTQNKLKLCLEATTEPQSDLYDQDKLQTIVAHQTLFINTHMHKNTQHSLGSFWKHWWSHYHLWSECFDREVGVSEDKMGRTAEGNVTTDTINTITTIPPEPKLKRAWASDPHILGIPEILPNRTLTSTEWTLTFQSIPLPHFHVCLFFYTQSDLIYHSDMAFI